MITNSVSRCLLLALCVAGVSFTAACSDPAAPGADPGATGGIGGEQATPPDPTEFTGTDWYWNGDEAQAVPAGSRAAEDGGAIADAGLAASGGSSALGASVAEDASSDVAAPPVECIGDCEPIDVAAGQLTAGEWNDLDNWDFFRALLDSTPEQGESWSEMDDYWGFDSAGRVSVRVVDGAGPVVNATVTLRDAQKHVLWQALTGADGEAELFAGMFEVATGPYAVEASRGDSTAEAALEAATGAEPVQLTLPAAASQPRALDLMFMIDTTGSMGDELAYIQTELLDVIQRVEDRSTEDLAVRLSVNFYRDDGDEYVVRAYPFTTDVETAVEALAQQSAAGGGDFEEAVDRALEVAVSQHEWSPVATTRLLFLVLDAPPHHEPELLARLHASTRQAAEQGIRIIALSASGIDKETEFLLRFFGVATEGTYTFLTDHSGIGNAHLDPNPTIGEHEVELLNDLLVRLISERLG